ncbi:hypothetical protein ABTY20_16335 [Streptomyces sp. NPDC126497]
MSVVITAGLRGDSPQTGSSATGPWPLGMTNPPSATKRPVLVAALNEWL